MPAKTPRRWQSHGQRCGVTDSQSRKAWNTQNLMWPGIVQAPVLSLPRGQLFCTKPFQLDRVAVEKHNTTTRSAFWVQGAASSLQEKYRGKCVAQGLFSTTETQKGVKTPMIIQAFAAFSGISRCSVPNSNERRLPRISRENVACQTI